MNLQPTTRAIALAALLLAAQAATAGDECDAVPQDWQPRSAVHARAAANGWHVDKLKVDDGCYEIKGRDADGRRFKAKLDPASLDVVRIKRERRDRGREHDVRMAPSSAESD